MTFSVNALGGEIGAPTPPSEPPSHTHAPTPPTRPPSLLPLLARTHPLYPASQPSPCPPDASAQTRKEMAASKKKATSLIVERETEMSRLQAKLAKAHTREPSSAAERTAREVALTHERVATLNSEVARLQRERDEWQLRNLELHQALRTASVSDAIGSGGASETLLQVAKQQAQRDEELMGARIQVRTLA